MAEQKTQSGTLEVGNSIRSENTARRASNGTRKAVISTGGKQYLVAVGDEIEVELLKPEKTASFDALLVLDGDKTHVGNPVVDNSKVTGDIVEQVVKQDKVVAIRYKSKKRVHKRRGHRQKLSRIKITQIS